MGDIVNNKVDHRFELVVDGHLAAAFYRIDGNVITFIHTEVPPELGGRGVGSKLVQGALDQVRASGMKVIAASGSISERLLRFRAVMISGGVQRNLHARMRWFVFFNSRDTLRPRFVLKFTSMNPTCWLM